MDWSISENSSRCVHKSGAIVYFDPHISSSGGLRCVGPFHAPASSSQFMRSIMRELTLHLEEKFSEERAYVLWGAYEDVPEYEDHEFLIHGSICGHIPSVSLRGKIIGPDLANEWTANGEGYLHRSGLDSLSKGSNEIDKSAFHPVTIFSEVETLLSQLRIQHAVFEVQPKATPLLRWTCRNIGMDAAITPQPQPESQLVHLARRVR